MGSGGSRLMAGGVVGTGATLNVRTIGFRPSYVEIFNTTGNAKATWVKGMADDSAQKTVDSGAGATDISLITSLGITPLSDGFTLGADTDLNVADEQIRYVAHE